VADRTEEKRGILNWVEEATVKYRNHEEVRNEFVKTRQDEAAVAAFKEEALAEVRAHRLAEVRQQHGLTQTDLADRLHISQTAVSKIERGELARSELSTIRKYVEALGGRLEIIADFGDERLVLG
jgi:DNA-binding XRE family transcriptional regulator